MSATCAGTAANKPVAATSEATTYLPPSGGAGPSTARRGGTPAAVPASSQNAAVAGAQSKLTSDHVKYAAAAPATPATPGSPRRRHTTSHQAPNSHAHAA